MSTDISEDNIPFSKVVGVLVKTQRVLMILTSSFTVLAVTAMACLRFLFKMNLYGIEEYILLFAIWMYFIGAANGSYKKNHVYASVIDLIIKNPKVLLVTQLAAKTLTFALFVVFCVYSVDFIRFSIQAGGQTPLHHIPFAAGHIAIAISLFLMAFYSALYLFCDYRDLFNKHRTVRKIVKNC